MQRLHSGQKPVPIHSIHCSGQRGDYKIGKDPRRPNLVMNYEFAQNHIMNLHRTTVKLVMSFEFAQNRIMNLHRTTVKLVMSFEFAQNHIMNLHKTTL